MKRLIIALAAISGGCVTGVSTRTTSQIYEEAVLVGLYSSRCSAAHAIDLEKKLEPLIPWLNVELGTEQFWKSEIALRKI